MTRAAAIPFSHALPGQATPHARLRGLLARLAVIPALHRQRCALAVLDDRLLADIGVTRAQAEAELDAPIWDAPRHWRG